MNETLETTRMLLLDEHLLEARTHCFRTAEKNILIPVMIQGGRQSLLENNIFFHHQSEVSPHIQP